MKYKFAKLAHVLIWLVGLAAPVFGLVVADEPTLSNAIIRLVMLTLCAWLTYNCFITGFGKVDAMRQRNGDAPAK